jgi:hypothetical protein
MLEDKFPRIMGADPGAVKLRDGGWLLTVTGPPRERQPFAGLPKDRARFSKSAP